MATDIQWLIVIPTIILASISMVMDMAVFVSIAIRHDKCQQTKEIAVDCLTKRSCKIAIAKNRIQKVSTATSASVFETPKADDTTLLLVSWLVILNMIIIIKHRCG